MKLLAVAIAFAALLTVGAISFVSRQDAAAQQGTTGSGDVFAGKAIIITPTPGVAGKPMQNVRVETLADRKFLVHQVSNDDDASYDYWMAADQISRIRVFDTMEEATAFYESRSEKGVFH